MFTIFLQFLVKNPKQFVLLPKELNLSTHLPQELNLSTHCNAAWLLNQHQVVAVYLHLTTNL